MVAKASTPIVGGLGWPGEGVMVVGGRGGIREGPGGGLVQPTPAPPPPPPAGPATASATVGTARRGAAPIPLPLAGTGIGSAREDVEEGVGRSKRVADG